jgi:hypothetical protein
MNFFTAILTFWFRMRRKSEIGSLNGKKWLRRRGRLKKSKFLAWHHLWLSPMYLTWRDMIKFEISGKSPHQTLDCWKGTQTPPCPVIPPNARSPEPRQSNPGSTAWRCGWHLSRKSASRSSSPFRPFLTPMWLQNFNGPCFIIFEWLRSYCSTD